MDASTSETCWALNKEIKKQVTSSWSLFNYQFFSFHSWVYLLYNFENIRPELQDRINCPLPTLHTAEPIHTFATSNTFPQPQIAVFVLTLLRILHDRRQQRGALLTLMCSCNLTLVHLRCALLAFEFPLGISETFRSSMLVPFFQNCPSARRVAAASLCWFRFLQMANYHTDSDFTL